MTTDNASSSDIFGLRWLKLRSLERFFNFIIILSHLIGFKPYFVSEREKNYGLPGKI